MLWGGPRTSGAAARTRPSATVLHSLWLLCQLLDQPQMSRSHGSCPSGRARVVPQQVKSRLRSSPRKTEHIACRRCYRTPHFSTRLAKIPRLAALESGLTTDVHRGILPQRSPGVLAVRDIPRMRPGRRVRRRRRRPRQGRRAPAGQPGIRSERRQICPRPRRQGNLLPDFTAVPMRRRSRLSGGPLIRPRTDQDQSVTAGGTPAPAWPACTSPVQPDRLQPAARR
jgi:hypothetical protein